MTAQQIITQHLDIWTAAYKTRSSAGRGSSNKLDLYGIKKLRELILELAVRGKLVPQDPNDEPSDQILERIATAKKKLIAEKKIKKAKLALDHEMPKFEFELPKGWSLPSLNDLIINSASDIVDGPFGSNLKATEYVEAGVPIIRIQNIDRNLFKENGLQFITLKKAKVLSRHGFLAGDIVLNKLGEPTGKACVVPNSIERGIIVADIIRIRIDDNLLDKQYLVNCINSPFVARQFFGLAKGVTRQRVNLSQVRSLELPFPPLLEQHRIVAKVDELMAFCDQLEQTQSDNIAAHAQLVEALLATLTNSNDHNELQNNWQRIAAHFDTLFTTEHSIDQLKQTILQLAVMGKLVPQNPNDEPASELLKKIAAEKAMLIKEGKIKKEKPLAEITDEEKPFELPSGWEWEKLSNITTGMDSGWSPACLANSSPSNDVWGVLKTTAVQIMEYLEFENKELPENLVPRPDAEVKQGDILFTRAGPMNRVGISCLVEKTRPKLMISDKIIRFHPVEIGIYGRFISLCLNAGGTATYLENAKSGMAASQVNISQEKLRSAPIPVAPLAEQHRIVIKVDELMAICDTLKTNLQNAQTTQLALADALVESVIGVSHSLSSPVINEELSMEIKTSLELTPKVKLKADAVLANIISEEGSIDAKRLWQKSKMDLPSFYKQLKKEISAGYILKPAVAEIQ